MPSYILRNTDPELWKRVKDRAQSDGHPLRWLILKLLDYYTKHGLPKPPR